MKSFAIAAAAACSSFALGHNHITLDTASGSPGDKIIIRAGYNPSETAFSIQNGRLYVSNGPAFYNVSDALASGDMSGWFAGDELVLTADFYAATGRLSGSDLRWEITSVLPITGDGSVVAWGTFGTEGGFSASAYSSAPDRIGRSYTTAPGSHNHGQGYAFSSPGIVDVTFVVWDVSGKYADSDPFIVRFRAGVPCPADLNADGVVEDSDFTIFVSAYNTLDCSDPSMTFGCPSDLNQDGFVDDGDFGLFVQLYDGLLCP